jgi:single-strand DNA-binding protein
MKANNLVILQGHLGATPEGRLLPSGARAVRLRLATHCFWKSKSGERSERTDWHHVEVWDRLAEFCLKYLQKGDKVQVLGAIRNDVVERDGKKLTYSSVRAWEINALSSIGSRTPRSMEDNGSAAAAVTAEAMPF